MNCARDDEFSDFTLKSYAELINMARSRFRFRSFAEFTGKGKSILLRHDVEVSLDRALAMAKVEASLGVSSTFFLNPMAPMYSIFEEREKIQQIMELGHSIGLHFDSSRHRINSQLELEKALGLECEILQLAMIEPVAFSFHNPTLGDLGFTHDQYAGLINAYSKRMFSTIKYVSDSNGYWRHGSLQRILEEGDAHESIQVLVHPEWWQEFPMAPRRRIYLSLVERSIAQMNTYDSTLAAQGRSNKTGMSSSMESLVRSRGNSFTNLDMLWNTGRLETLFIELWRLHESQINTLCKALFHNIWGVPEREVSAFFGDDSLRIEGWKLFELAFETPWLVATGTNEAENVEWGRVLDKLLHARDSVGSFHVEAGCVYLSQIITRLASWGLESRIKSDGLTTAIKVDIPFIESERNSTEESLDQGIESLFGTSHRFERSWRDLKAGVYKHRESSVESS
jgi:hypothetical protein